MEYSCSEKKCRGSWSKYFYTDGTRSINYSYADGTYNYNVTTCTTTNKCNTTETRTITIDSQSPYYWNIPDACNINSTRTYEDAIITANCKITVNATTGDLTLRNTTLYAQEIDVEQGATFKIEDSRNTIIHNDNFTISGTAYINNSVEYFNATYDGEIGVNVTSTGSLYIINNSNIST